MRHGQPPDDAPPYELARVARGVLGDRTLEVVRPAVGSGPSGASTRAMSSCRASTSSYPRSARICATAQGTAVVRGAGLVPAARVAGVSAAVTDREQRVT